MTKNLEELAQSVLDVAKRAGADAADAIISDGTAINVDVRAGALEQAERAEGIDVGLRVLIGTRQACVSISDTSQSALVAMAERAVAMAREAPEDPFAGLADPSQVAREWDISALELADPSDEPTPAALQADAQTAEAAALAHEGISQVQSASASYSARQLQYASTNGFSAGLARTSRVLSCVAIAGTGLGMERDYDGDGRTFQSDIRPAEEIGRTAAERALARVGAKKPPTGAYPILFDERIASSLIGHLLGAANGSAVARGASWLKDKQGSQILPKGLSVLEDPTRPRMAASRPFDAEGLPTKTRAIVEDGILTGWTLDLATSRKLGMETTGNAMRSVSAPPSPGNWNIELTQGTASRDDLIRDMGTGLLVTSMIGATINPNTGDYSRGAAGLWIENGEITHPVNECTIAGNLLQMLGTLLPANDARPYLSRVVPSLLVEGMTVAGN